MATRDSSLFNIELYTNYIKKGLNILFVSNWEPRPVLNYVATSADLTPQNMIYKLEELSFLSKLYIENYLDKRISIRNIWTRSEDKTLNDIVGHYDHIRAVIKQSDVNMIRESVDEYPSVVLKDFKILSSAPWKPILAAIIFPVWGYLFLKVWMQKHTLRNELQNIMGGNRNLVNELNSIV